MFKRLCFAVAALSLAAAGASGAYEVQPLASHVQPSGEKGVARLKIKNPGEQAITIEFTPYRLQIDEAGAITRIPDETDVLVFPPQTVVQPGREQVVQVRYVGDPALQTGRIYGVLVSQAPVDFENATLNGSAAAGVKVAFNYFTHLYVDPPGLKPALSVSEAARQADGGLTFVVENEGRATAMLRQADFVLAGADGAPSRIPTEQVELGEIGALPGGSRRTVRIKPEHAKALAAGVRPTVRLN